MSKHRSIGAAAVGGGPGSSKLTHTLPGAGTELCRRAGMQARTAFGLMGVITELTFRLASLEQEPDKPFGAAPARHMVCGSESEGHPRLLLFHECCQGVQRGVARPGCASPEHGPHVP